MDEATTPAGYFQHKFKCMPCGLHFITCTWKEDWPGNYAQVHCPECGNTGPFIHWVQPVEGFIFQAVPGEADLVGIFS